MDLTEQAKAFAESRVTVATLQATAKRLETEFREQHAELYTNLDTAKVKLEATEGALRACIVAQFKETGNKHPAAGLGIREDTELIYSPKKALDWAKEHKMCLSLDKKAFEKVAKATPDALPFVTQEKVPTATVATDLSAYLKGEQEDAGIS